MSEYAREVARRREAAIRATPVTGEQMGLEDLLIGLGRTGALSYGGGAGLGLFDALTQRLQGGAPLDPYAYPPTPTGAIRLGGRYAPRTPGLTAETLEHKDPIMDFEGQKDWFPRKGRPGAAAYNLRNEAGEIVASADRQRSWGMKNRAYVPQMWVREDYRKTPAMFDLYNLLSRGGKETLSASFANERLRKVFEKRMQRQGKLPLKRHYDSDLDDIELIEPDEFDGSLTLSPSSDPIDDANMIRGRRPSERERIRFARQAEETRRRYLIPEPDLPMESRRQVTNRDVPSVRQMAPVRRSQPVTRPLSPIQRQEARYATQDARIGTLKRELEALDRTSARAVAASRARRTQLNRVR